MHPKGAAGGRSCRWNFAENRRAGQVVLRTAKRRASDSRDDASDSGDEMPQIAEHLFLILQKLFRTLKIRNLIFVGFFKYRFK